MVPKMVRTLETLTSADSPRELGWSSLRKRQLRGDFIPRENESGLFLEA